MAMKIFSVLIAAGLWVCALGGTGWCKNHVYKGTIVATDLFTGATIKAPTYLVIGDAQNVSDNDNYQFVSSRLVLLGPGLGRKRFLRQLAPNFRSLRQTLTVDGKPRTTVVLTSSDGFPDIGDGGHVTATEVLSGLVNDALYAMPLKLAGTTLRSTGQSQGSAPATGAASTLKWKFALVRDLTDPVRRDTRADRRSRGRLPDEPRLHRVGALTRAIIASMTNRPTAA